MAAVAKKLLSEFNLNNIKALFETSEKYMITNISIANAGWFAMKALDVKIEDMRVHMLPSVWFGAPVNHNEVFKAETIEIINKYYNPYKEDIPESSFNIYDRNITKSTYKPAIEIDGMSMDTLIN